MGQLVLNDVQTGTGIQASVVIVLRCVASRVITSRPARHTTPHTTQCDLY